MATRETDSSSDMIDLRDLFTILWSNLWIILLTAILFGTVGWAVSNYLLTPQYRASSTVIVNKGPDQTGAMSAITYNDLLMSQKLVKTYSIVMQSDTVLTKVISALGLDVEAEDIRGALSVSGVNDTEVLKVSFTHTDPVVAAAVANEIVKQAPEEIIRTAKVGSVEVVDWAVVPDSPVKPQKVQNALIAAVIGGILATGIVFLREMLDNTFKSDEDLKERYDLPVLGVLPLYRPEAEPETKRGGGY